MSVYARLRPESKLEFFNTGHKLECEVIRVCMSEKKIPKKWRFSLGYKAINTALDMMQNLVEANNVYANTKEKLALRESLQNKALADIKELDHLFVVMLESIASFTADDLSLASKLMYEEEEHIKKWKKSNKLVGQQKI